MAAACPSAAAALGRFHLALAASALLLTASMLIATGTTRAWLTSSVVNEGNVVTYVEPTAAPSEAKAEAEEPEEAEAPEEVEQPAQEVEPEPPEDTPSAEPLPLDPAGQDSGSAPTRVEEGG